MTIGRMFGVLAASLWIFASEIGAQGLGSIRGVVYDKDFEAPLPLANVRVLETDQKATTGELGNYVIGEVEPGTYTVVFSKEGYLRQVRSNVIVRAGELTELDAQLSGEFAELEEYVVQDVLQIGAGSEAALLELRFESPSLMDSIGAELMSRAGVSDAANALRLVPGATVQDGRFAVIRGLPDRYVSSQVNGVRLPSADENTRAVELDQFPTPVLDSIQVTKTFTPDQQGDASGGAVNVVLKGIPEERVFRFGLQTSYNSQVTGESDFLSYDGGGVNFLGDDNDRGIQTGNIGGNWDGAVGVTTEGAPLDYKWSLAYGNRTELGNGNLFGGFASLFYERDSSFFDDGIDDSLWLKPGDTNLTPEQKQFQGNDEFDSALFDVVKGTESVQWGGIATLGLETDASRYDFTLLFTRTAEDEAVLAENTRGKHVFFPGHDPNDPSSPGHSDPEASPYLRTETLQYTERTVATAQLRGSHDLGSFLGFEEPKLDWTLAHSLADQNQPDKRLFGSRWFPANGVIPATHVPFRPAASFRLGNLQRIFKTVKEDSNQVSTSLKLPFDPWIKDKEAYVRVGAFHDDVAREFNQDTFTNSNDAGAFFVGNFEDLWSEHWSGENHAINAAETDVDYDGDQKLSAAYVMSDLPLSSDLNVVSGLRFESTKISIVNKPEPFAQWFPPGSLAAFALAPGDADVTFEQNDVLPSLGLVYTPTEEVTVRTGYSKTVARQTFKELTPILQQEFLGGPVFIGNPDLGMSDIDNYDLRVDYTPSESSLVSVSWFYKDLSDPIEFVQRIAALLSFTTARNYPEGYLTGWEFEVRQDLEPFTESLSGLSIGGNATFIQSEVTLPADEAMRFSDPLVNAPMSRRDATGAPEHLYNLYLTYDFPYSDTQLGIFYTVRGDTLVAGAGVKEFGELIPNVYELEYGTLNLSLTHRFRENFSVKLQAKNITNPDIETAYRSEYVQGGDVTRSSFSRGAEFTIGITFSM